MDNLGDRVAYLVLVKGTPVYSSDDEQVGTVSEVRAAGNADIFEGVVFSHMLGHHYVAADQIDAIYERGVVLTLDAEACKQLPKPRN